MPGGSYCSAGRFDIADAIAKLQGSPVDRMTSTVSSATALDQDDGPPRRAAGFIGWIMSPERRGPLLVAPAIITLFVVNIFPLMWSFGLSFYEYKANRIAPPAFKGLANYADILTDSEIWARFQNTALIVVGSVTLQLIVGFLLALLFAQEFPLRRYLLMLVLSPMMLSLSAVGVFFKLFYDPTLGFQAQNEVSCYGGDAAYYSASGGDGQDCLTGSSFLHPVDAHRPRTIQLALKLVF